MSKLQETKEELSAKIHKIYCVQYEKDNGKPYWTNGDYSKLDEKTKQYDRNIADFIFSILQEIDDKIENKKRPIADINRGYNTALNLSQEIIREYLK